VKGIKECVNWMIDNPGKMLEHSQMKVWYDGCMLLMFDIANEILYNERNEDSYGSEVFSDYNILDEYEWEPVIEPVDVKEAMRAHEDGKTIKSVCNDGVGSVYKDSDLYDQFGTIISCNEIANGTWYILD